MKRVLAEHKFTKNGARICVSYVAKERGVPKCDPLLLEFRSHGEDFGVYMRPDEAVLVIEKLASALYQIVRGYEIGLLRKKRRKHEQT